MSVPGYRQKRTATHVTVRLPRGAASAIAAFAENMLDDVPDTDAAPISEAATLIEQAIRDTDRLVEEGGGSLSPQKPTRSEGGMHDDYREDHPAYALIGASRVTSSGRALFGSDFLHQHYVNVTVKTASLVRGHASDHTFGGRQLIEVALSEAQWATFVSAMNIGDGVPCTLASDQDGAVPGVVHSTNRREQFNAEIDDRLQTTLTAIDDVLAAGKLRAADRQTLERAKMQLTDSLPFVAKRFDEHAEETVEKAKMEVNAYVTNAVMSAGLRQLGAGPIMALPEPAPDALIDDPDGHVNPNPDGSPFVMENEAGSVTR